VSHYENNYFGGRKASQRDRRTAWAELDLPKRRISCSTAESVRTDRCDSYPARDIFRWLVGWRRRERPAVGVNHRRFGSFDRWRTEFVAMGKAEAGLRLGHPFPLAPRQTRSQSMVGGPHHDTGPVAGGACCSICTSTPIIWTWCGAARMSYITMGGIRWENAATLYDR